jgi:hypothetical protein
MYRPTHTSVAHGFRHGSRNPSGEISHVCMGESRIADIANILSQMIVQQSETAIQKIMVIIRRINEVVPSSTSQRIGGELEQRMIGEAKSPGLSNCG